MPKTVRSRTVWPRSAPISRSAEDRLKRLRDERSAALAKKRQLDEANEKTLQTEAEIARLEEELARLKGEEAAASRKPGDSAPAPTTVVRPSN